jgi:hypothetical protein
VTLAAFGLFTAAPAAAAPTPCPPGRYLIGTPLFTGGATPAVIETTETGASLTPCGPGEGKVKAKRKFTKLKAKWDTCGEFTRVVLTGKIPAGDCSTLTAKLKAKKTPAQVIEQAAVSACGDAVIDVEGGEECDGSAADGDEACPGRCRTTADEEGEACTCMPEDFIGGEAGGDQAATVALSADGTRVVIGAPFNDGTAGSAGHARVFEHAGSGWTQLGADLDGEAADDRFGGAVAISNDGNRVAVGSYLNDGGGNASGHVRVFDFAGGSWTQVGADIDGPAGRGAGWAVDLSASGARVIVGGPGVGSGTGVATVYELVGGVWTMVGTPITGALELGHAVAISDDGNRIAVSQPSGSSNGPGTTSVFDWSGSAWQPVGQPIAGEAADDAAGSALSLSADGSMIAIGAPSNVGEGLDGGGGAGGHVRVYRLTTGTWTQVGSDLDGTAGSAFGTSVSLSGDGTRLLAGGPNPSTIRWYTLAADTWTLQTTPAFVADRRAGSSVSLSADGTTGAVGAEYGDTDAGNAAGIVRVYDLS